MCFHLLVEVALERKTNKQASKQITNRKQRHSNTHTHTHTYTHKHKNKKINPETPATSKQQVEVVLMKEALSHSKREMTGAGKKTE